MAIPQLWLFAGPNGAGKTTFTQFPSWSGRISHFLNADELTSQLLREQGYSTYTSLEHLPWFASRADHFYVYDNSDSDPYREPVLVAREGPSPGTLRLHDREANPPLVQTLLASKLFSQILEK